MELPSRILEQITFNIRPKIEEHMLVVIDKSTHEEHLAQTLQTNNKQFKIAVVFLTVIMVFSMLQIPVKNFIQENNYRLRQFHPNRIITSCLRNRIIERRSQEDCHW